MDQYREIVSGELAEIKIKGSRFIGEATPVYSKEEAEAVLHTIKKREYTATHHCWAYRIGTEGNVFRFNDDGEPSGTAGPPILRQVDHFEITNVIVVVTRYYGGTKLGKGGLIRAYGDAARSVLEACEVEEKIVRVEVRISFAYDDTSAAMHVINSYDINIVGSEYGNDTSLVLAIRASAVQAFKQAFVDKLRGRGVVKLL